MGYVLFALVLESSRRMTTAIGLVTPKASSVWVCQFTSLIFFRLCLKILRGDEALVSPNWEITRLVVD